MKKMGISREGTSFLDKFRELITQIGNTLGFIRMFRAGASEFNAYAAQFVPSSEIFKSFVEETSKLVENCVNLKPSAELLNLLNQSVNDFFNNAEDYLEVINL